ncbi:MAG TPA: M56 family metallopeptidase [Vicinamibacterales bacterium]|jgi:uncharacterized protein (TIGR03435 family)|nr:M56 family metallopeptidase [Vicinamibacterales bacterium]
MGAILNHLWQSTVFATGVAILVLAFRENRARVRYWLWFTASLKFLIPFAPLATLGAHLYSATPAPAATPSLLFTVAEIGQPLLDGPISTTSLSAETVGSSALALATLTVWASGCLALVFVRFRTWHRIRQVVNSGTPARLSSQDVPAQVGVMAVARLMEPAVVGIWRQTLVVPLGIDMHLTQPQLRAVVAHELCHVRHRDNLTAAIHMVVEAVYWFHPAVWLIGSRLIHERERACDEDVLVNVGRPRVYAEAILNVCKGYVAVPSWGAGVSSANLRRRIESIMAERIGRSLNARGKLVLATSGLLSLALPIASGSARAMVHAAATERAPRVVGLQAPPVSIADLPSFEVASVKRNTSGEFFGSFGYEPGGRLLVVNNAVRSLIRSAYGLQNYQILGGPDWMSSDRYDVSARAVETASREQLGLMLRRLLSERFKLVVQRETREIPIYALVVARPGRPLGPALRPAAVDCMAIVAAAEQRGVAPDLPAPQRDRPACGTRSMPGAMIGTGVSMSDLARNLAGPAERMVVDKTSLKGPWDLDLRYVMNQTAPNIPGVPPPPDDGASLFTALQEQLGLKLEPQRAAVDVLLVVSIERPTEN